MKRLSRQSGISLIEVLVVIVLLLIGILSVVRLFPGGFLLGQRSEATTLAARLAAQEKDRYATAAANLPDAILPTIIVPDAGSPTGYYIKVDLDTTPDDLTSRSAPPGVDPHYTTGINRIRWIQGEQVRIPNATPLGDGVRGSVYMLNSGPIFDYPGLDYDNNPVDSIAAHGAPMVRRHMQYDPADAPMLRSPAEYGIDYDDGMIAFYPAPYPRQFSISYSYYEGATVGSMPSRQIDVPADSSGVATWVAIYPPGGRDIVPDSDVVSRGFRRVAFPPSWSDDPYEYAVMPKTANVAGFAGIGVLIFNPLGRDYVERSAYGNVPLTARVDYNVLDWHIIREDRPMPAEAPYMVPLTLKNIKRAGDLEDDQTTYTGIWRDSSAPRVSVLVYNVSTGLEVPISMYRVDYRSGTVTFDDEFGAVNASANFRYYYKAKGEWGLSVQKAASTYTRVRSVDRLGVGNFVLGDAGIGAKTRMYFPLMEAGKTVSIRDIWYYDGTNTEKHVTNETYRINSDRLGFERIGGRTLTWIDLTDAHPDAQDGGWVLDKPLEPASGVQGISFKTRVVWTNGGTVTRTSTGANIARVRWLKTDVDTFLTRGQN